MNTITESPRTTWLLRAAAVIWVVWGLVHMLAGILTISGDTTDAVQGIANGVEPERHGDRHQLHRLLHQRALTVRR